MRLHFLALVSPIVSGLILQWAVARETAAQMRAAETPSEEKLVDLARREFCYYSEDFEAKGRYRRATFDEFFENVEKGQKTDLRMKDPGKEDPLKVDIDKWNEDRTIDANWIRWLFTDLEAFKKVAPIGIELDYARITGKVDLSNLKIPFNLTFFCCAITSDLFLNDTEIDSLSFQGSYIQKLNGTGLNVKRDLVLSQADGTNGTSSRPFCSGGTVWLRRARIGGTLACTNAHFTRDPPPADEKADLPHALDLNSAKIGADLSLRYCKAIGVVVMDAAQIAGNLYCDGATFDGRANDQFHPGRHGDNAIFARRLRVTGDVWLKNGTVSGKLSPFSAFGTVQIADATIDGTLDCSGGTFSNADNEALDAASVKVGFDVNLSGLFTANGVVNLSGSTIGGTLNCENGHFDYGFFEERTALNADSAKIDCVSFGSGFTARGKLDFSHSVIQRRFEIDQSITLDSNTALWLENATVGQLSNKPQSWDKAELHLRGFTFNGFGSDVLPSKVEQVASQLAWLRANAQPFSPQPYEQLAAVLRGAGLKDEALKILIAKNDDEGSELLTRDWKSITSTVDIPNLLEFGYHWCWYRLLGPLIGYGFHPGNALGYSGLVVIVGSVIFKIGHWKGIVVPTGSESYAKFCAFIYSLETFVPLVDLRMAEYWIPDPNRCAYFPEADFSVPGSAFRVYLWLHIGLGYVLTTLWVAAFTGIIKP